MATGGELAEAVLAIAGVPNQHNSPNRDFFITIVEENIMPGKILHLIFVIKRFALTVALTQKATWQTL